MSVNTEALEARFTAVAKSLDPGGASFLS